MSDLKEEIIVGVIHDALDNCDGDETMSVRDAIDYAMLNKDYHLLYSKEDQAFIIESAFETILVHDLA